MMADAPPPAQRRAGSFVFDWFAGLIEGGNADDRIKNGCVAIAMLTPVVMSAWLAPVTEELIKCCKNNHSVLRGMRTPLGPRHSHNTRQIPLAPVHNQPCPSQLLCRRLRLVPGDDLRPTPPSRLRRRRLARGYL